MLNAWVSIGEPRLVLASMRRQYPALAGVLGRTEDEAARRRLLGRIADRLAATPGLSDPERLCAIVDWESLFLGRGDPGMAQLDALSRDLVLLFTERGPDAISRSGSELYRAGRFGDEGFEEALRDGSDQVRHFCWSFRVFTIHMSRADAEELLRLKEVRDSTRRKEPVNQADLLLNRAARELVEEILGKREGGQDGRRGDPHPVSAYSALIRKKLAGAGR
ncbi:MAG: hypothetical protein ACE5F1_05245 [Planctomycetota bacterium]